MKNHSWAGCSEPNTMAHNCQVQEANVLGSALAHASVGFVKSIQGALQKWSRETSKGRLKKGVNHSMSITRRIVNYRPIRRIINKKESSVTGPNREGCTSDLVQEINHPYSSPNEKLSSLWTLAFLQWTFLQNNPHPPNSSSLIK